MISSEPYGYVYEITNLINGKTYIGQRKISYDKSWRHYLGSGKAIKAAIKLYGKENFVKTFICYAWSSEELTAIEDDLIVQAWNSGKCQYNLGRTPAADQVRRLPEAVALARNEKLSRKMIEWVKANPESHWNSIRTKKRQEEYERFRLADSDKVVDLYSTLLSIEKVALALEKPQQWIALILKERDVELNHRTKVGVKHSEETRAKIAASRIAQTQHLQKKCPVCNIEFRAKRARVKTCSKECGREISRIK